MIVAKFEYDINRLERPIIENERRDLARESLEREENEKSSSTKSNTSSTIVNSQSEAKQIVDISNLEWKDEEEIIDMTWDEAFRNTPKGWRIPTIQELYSQIVNNGLGFNSRYYWSSSTDKSFGGVHWIIDSYRKSVIVDIGSNSVRYVRDKR
jgi:hypothetical protein